MTVPVVLHVDGLCMSRTLGCSTFLDLSETYPQLKFQLGLRLKLTNISYNGGCGKMGMNDEIDQFIVC